MSESTDFPIVAWVDFNGPGWDTDDPNDTITIQQHCSRRAKRGDKVLGVFENGVSWYTVDHLEDSFDGIPDEVICLKSRADNAVWFGERLNG